MWTWFVSCVHSPWPFAMCIGRVIAVAHKGKKIKLTHAFKCFFHFFKSIFHGHHSFSQSVCVCVLGYSVGFKLKFRDGTTSQTKSKMWNLMKYFPPVWDKGAVVRVAACVFVSMRPCDRLATFPGLNLVSNTVTAGNKHEKDKKITKINR